MSRNPSYKVGIVGLGVVGSACKFGFEKLGHQTRFHDPKLGTSLSDVLDTDMVFLCVPTPPCDDGSCDISIVDETISRLDDARYSGLIVIKSTVSPGTTARLSQKYPNRRIGFVPEFLRERCAISDFVENHRLLAVGCANEEDYRLVVSVHGHYPKKTRRMGVSEAEMLKYYSNVFNALRIIFANEVYEVCNAIGVDYDEVKNAYIETGAVPDVYLDVNENFRGYGGICLPKDVKALANLIESLGLDHELIRTIDKENSKYKTTVFSGMRL